MKKLLSVVLFSAFVLYRSIEASSLSDVKVLVLIIANDTPLYNELQKLWKSYMHLDRKHIEAYFIKADDRIEEPYEIRDDVLWIKTKDSLIPGVLNKTVLSFEAMLPRIKNEFDYIVRTNLSSFYIFPRLLNFLETRNTCNSIPWTQLHD